VRRSIALWRTSPRPGGEIDLLLARAACLVLALLAAHSLVDYPLRTGAMMALFAFAAALTFEPPDAPEPVRPARPRARPKKPSADVSSARPAPPPFGPAPPRRPPDQDWSDMEWPEAWRRPPDRSDHN